MDIQNKKNNRETIVKIRGNSMMAQAHTSPHYKYLPWPNKLMTIVIVRIRYLAQLNVIVVLELYQN